MIKSAEKKLPMNMLPVLFSLAWPTMLEQLFQTAVQYIDTAMVGALGTDATAAVGSTGTIGWLVISSISALGIGFLAYVARACGAGDRQATARTASQAVLLVLLIGSVFTVLLAIVSPYVPGWMQVDSHIRSMASAYFFVLYLPMLPRTASLIFSNLLRAVGDTKTPMRVGVVVNVINVILNFILIYPSREIVFGGVTFTLFGAGMGVVGAATASAIAFTAGGIMTTIALWNHPLISPRGWPLRLDMEVLRPCLKIAIPNMLQRFGTALGFVAFAAMINSLGGVATATHAIANTVESAFYIPGWGMQTAAATLAGNALGAKDRKRLHDLLKISLVVVVFLMIISAAMLFFSAPYLMRLFSKSPEVIGLGVIVLRMVAISEPFYGLSIILEGVLQGLGNTVIPFVYGVMGMWCVRIVGTFVCTQILEMGLVSTWACMIANNMSVCLMYILYYARGKWDPFKIKVPKEA